MFEVNIYFSDILNQFVSNLLRVVHYRNYTELFYPINDFKTIICLLIN